MRKLTIENAKIEYSFYLFAAVFLLLVPLRLALAWFLAVAVHELSHYTALRLCGVKMISVTVGAAGMKMETEMMSKKQELICALAGPLGGFCMLFLAHWLPCTAICAFIHSVFNLLPVFPLDGGRALRCVMYKLFGDMHGREICTWIGYVFILLLFVSAVVLALRFDMGMLPIALVLLIFGKIKLANRRNK